MSSGKHGEKVGFFLTQLVQNGGELARMDLRHGEAFRASKFRTVIDDVQLKVQPGGNIGQFQRDMTAAAKNESFHRAISLQIFSL